MGRLSVSLCGIELENPVIPASGTFGYGYEFAELYDINCLGTFSFKGTTLAERVGNPLPRIAETGAGMLNAVGLQNPGVEKVIAEELPKLAGCFHKPVIANVSGFSESEYAEVCRRLERAGAWTCGGVSFFRLAGTLRSGICAYRRNAAVYFLSRKRTGRPSADRTVPLILRTDCGMMISPDVR